jgi:hypothetical protein
MQIGRLPVFHASYGRMNGKDCGLVDDLWDIQQTINKRESLIDTLIANSAAGGGVIDPELFGNDYTKLEEVKANINNPTYRTFSAPGEVASGRKHIEEFPRAQNMPIVTEEIARMWEMTNQIGMVPPVLEAISEGSEDRAGTLYARKAQQAEMNLTIPNKTLENYWNEKGEAYMAVAKVLHAGVYVYREFKKPGSEESFAVNEEITTPEGTVTVNDISKLSRHKVVVSQSPQGVTYREVQRTINSELLNKIPAANPLSRAVAVSKVMKALDSTTEERDEYEIASEKEKELAFAAIDAQIAGFQLQKATIEARMQNPLGRQQEGGKEGEEEAEGAQAMPGIPEIQSMLPK